MRSCDNCKKVYIEVPIPIVEVCQRIKNARPEVCKYSVVTTKEKIPLYCPDCKKKTRWES